MYLLSTPHRSASHDRQDRKDDGRRLQEDHAAAWDARKQVTLFRIEAGRKPYMASRPDGAGGGEKMSLLYFICMVFGIAISAAGVYVMVARVLDLLLEIFD